MLCLAHKTIWEVFALSQFSEFENIIISLNVWKNSLVSPSRLGVQFLFGLFTSFEVNCIYVEIHQLFMYSSMSFDKWIHPYQDTEHFHHRKKFPFLLLPHNVHQVAITVVNFNYGLVLAV